MFKSQPIAITTNKHRSSRQSSRKMNKLIICSICFVVSITLLNAKTAEAGRLQEFFQNLVGGGSSSSSSGSSSSNSNSNSNSNSGNSNSNSNSNNDSNDPDTAAAGENNSGNDQSMTPMMSAMSPYLRYPSFYDSFAPGASAGYGGFPGYSFSNPMGAMSGMAPMAAMSSGSFGGAFSPASFGPASFGAAFGSPATSAATNPMSAFASQASGMGSASSLNNVYANSPSLMAAGYTPYYGRRK